MVFLDGFGVQALEKFGFKILKVYGDIVDPIFKGGPSCFIYPGRKDYKRGFSQGLSHINGTPVVTNDHVAVVHDRNEFPQAVANSLKIDLSSRGCFTGLV